METVAVIKIGGNIIDEEEKLSSFLRAFAAIGGKKILVHGGGKLATKLASALGVSQQLVDGRRITDAETLKIVTMVYAGYINKNIVAQLQALGCNAVGLCGADGNLVLAHKRGHTTGKHIAGHIPGQQAPPAANAQQQDGPGSRQSGTPTDQGGIRSDIDYGYVGDVDTVDAAFLEQLLRQEKALVFAPITHDGNGQLLNTNADTIAGEIARALSASFAVSLVYSFEKSGVLMDAEDDGSVIARIDAAYYKELKDRQVIFAGMIPKLDNAFAALDNGVSKVIIGRAEELSQLLTGKSGTTIVHE